MASEPGYAHVVATKDFHVDPGAHFSDHPDYAASWPPHCVAGTPGADFHPNLDTGAVEAVFRKGAHAAAYSGFEGADDAGTPLADWLRARGVDQVDVVGIATDYCVHATAADAARTGFATRVLLDLTAGVAPESTAKAIEDLRALDVDLTGTWPRLVARPVWREWNPLRQRLGRVHPCPRRRAASGRRGPSGGSCRCGRGSGRRWPGAAGGRRRCGAVRRG